MGKAVRKVRSESQKNIVRLIEGIEGRYSKWDIWQDFIVMSAISIANVLGGPHKDSREKDYHAIDAIGLFESGLDQFCGVTVGILAPKADRLRRIMARDGIPEGYAQMRLDAQPEDGYFREKCDYILENIGTEAEFRRKSLDFFQKFL